MLHNPAEFVDRDAELRVFDRLLQDPHERVLLLYGSEGIGKSGLVHYLCRESRTRQLPFVLIDFRCDEQLAEEPCAVMRCLCQKIGGEFARHMLAVEQEARAAGTTASVQSGLAEAVAQLQAARTSNPGSGASIAGNVQVQHDFIGRDQIVINLPAQLLDPAAGPRLAEAQLEQRWCVEIRAAFRACLAAQPLLLFFDHYESAKEPVTHWLRRDILSLQIDEVDDDYAHLWITVAGRAVPLQEEIDMLARSWRGARSARCLTTPSGFFGWANAG